MTRAPVSKIGGGGDNLKRTPIIDQIDKFTYKRVKNGKFVVGCEVLHPGYASVFFGL